MDKNKLVVKIIGWIFIAGAFALLINGISQKTTLQWLNELRLLSQPAQDSKALNFQDIASRIVETSLMFFLTFFAGWGLLKMKPWARILALLVLIGYIFNATFLLLGFDPVFYSMVKTLLIFGTSIVLFTIFMLPFIKKQFEPSKKFKSFESLAKTALIIALLRAVAFLIGIFVILFIGMVYVDAFSRRLPTPVKVQYSVENKKYIEEQCSELEIFGFSIFLPEKWEISNLGRYDINPEDRSFVLNIVFQGNIGRGYGIISDDNFFNEMFSVYEKLGFTNSYEIEKSSLNKSKLSLFQIVSPIPLFLMPDWDSIEEVSSDSWVGFVKHDRRECEERVSWILECSAYSKDLNRSAGINLIFGENGFTKDQVRSILATLKFLEQSKTAEEYFRLGIEEKKKGKYKEAKLNFLNAVYFEPENPDYNYHMALLLYEIYQKEKEDSSDTEKKLSFLTIKIFLTYALEINPEHKEAKKLLSLID